MEWYFFAPWVLSLLEREGVIIIIITTPIMIFIKSFFSYYHTQILLYKKMATQKERSV